MKKLNPTTYNLEPTTHNSQLSTLNSQLSTLKSQLSSLNSQVSTLNSQRGNLIPLTFEIMRRLNVFFNSIRMTLSELNSNKVRATLSLIGVSFGIFCIISVLATVQSLEANIKNGLKDLGSNTVYVQKWPWGGGGDQPWWKYAKRPDPLFNELKPIKDRSQYADAVAFILFNSSNVEYKDNVLQRVNWYGVTEEYNQIQEIKIFDGRYISASEFQSGSNVVVMGYSNAESLFGSA